ncbi:hypothetical protein BH10PLA2_BH10PLA2_09510 [soil metagenome]
MVSLLDWDSHSLESRLEPVLTSPWLNRQTVTENPSSAQTQIERETCVMSSSNSEKLTYLVRIARQPILALILFASISGTARPDTPAEQIAAQKFADTIDQLINIRLRELGVPPSPRADDAEFMRRVSLDITGRIPVSHDVREFLASSDPNKRARLIDELLASPRYATHQAALWGSALLSETSATPEARFFRTGFEAWLRQRFRANVGFD